MRPVGVERLLHAFEEANKKGRKTLIVYVCAGDPDLKATAELVPFLAEAGADIIEIGVPFSDPIADGPTIQAASQRALAAGTSMAAVLNLVGELRSRLRDLPLVLMTYYNPVLRFGLRSMAATLKEKGGDGLIVPDLPAEEAGPLRSALDEHGLALVPLVAPTTPDSRLKVVVDGGRGFVYCVSLTGVTGAREELPPYLEAYLKRVRAATNLPLAVGFGISRPEQAARLAPLADGIVAGSAVVDAFHRGGLVAATGLVRALRAALDG
ncbi:MAG: tryptophan synthase alpha chain [Clostridia bacterium]|nr:tryptophan synthase alpha chain [Clostridia bacterium]